MSWTGWGLMTRAVAMINSQQRTIGVIGGMGPQATVDLYSKIIEETRAARDQDNLDVVIVADPRVPDRTEAIFGSGQDPVPVILSSARRCILAGAEFLVMPCNTAHHYYDALSGSVDVPIVHMIREVACHLGDRHPRAVRVGLMATSGTLRTQLYQGVLDEVGVSVAVPCDTSQDAVMRGIYGVKGGDIDEASTIFRQVADTLIDAGADAIIAGCTEIPLALGETGSIPLIDPTRVLARAAVQVATGQRDAVLSGGS